MFPSACPYNLVSSDVLAGTQYIAKVCRVSKSTAFRHLCRKRQCSRGRPHHFGLFGGAGGRGAGWWGRENSADRRRGASLSRRWHFNCHQPGECVRVCVRAKVCACVHVRVRTYTHAHFLSLTHTHSCWEGVRGNHTG